MRLFVALAPPPDVRAALATWAGSAVGGDPAFRLVAPEAMHVTLAFLGERPAEDPARLAPELARALDRCVPPRAARVGEPLWLAPRRPHVLTVTVEDGSGRLSELQEAVVGACRRALGWEPEGRPFRPHVTVARVRRNESVRPRVLPALPDAARGPWQSGAGVSLLRSSPGPDGAQYAPLWAPEG